MKVVFQGKEIGCKSIHLISKATHTKSTATGHRGHAGLINEATDRRRATTTRMLNAVSCISYESCEQSEG